MLPAIPLEWKVAGIAILLLVLGAIGVGLYVKGRSDGAAACEASVAKAVAKQAADDKTLSDRLLSTQKTVLDTLHAQSLSAQQKVANAPVTNTCGPVERDASRSVQSLIRGGASAP